MFTLWISTRKGCQQLPWDMEAQINSIFLNHTISSCNGCLLRPQHVNTLSFASVVLPRSCQPLDVYPTLSLDKQVLETWRSFLWWRWLGLNRATLSLKPDGKSFYCCV